MAYGQGRGGHEPIVPGVRSLQRENAKRPRPGVGVGGTPGVPTVSAASLFPSSHQSRPPAFGRSRIGFLTCQTRAEGEVGQALASLVDWLLSRETSQPREDEMTQYQLTLDSDLLQ